MSNRFVLSRIKQFIRRLTSGGAVAGKSDDPRVIQAKRLWDLGVGRDLGVSSFEAYLATVPEIPAELVPDDADYPLLVLIETRIGLKKLCGFGKIEFQGNDGTFVEHGEQYYEFDQPTWIRIQDGRKNRNRAVRDCRMSFVEDELGLTALQGVCAYLQHPGAVTETRRREGHSMDLFGSVHCSRCVFAAYLGVRGGRAELHWRHVDDAFPKHGSASRRECKAL